jgi:hypothetical protein
MFKEKMMSKKMRVAFQLYHHHLCPRHPRHFNLKRDVHILDSSILLSYFENIRHS